MAKYRVKSLEISGTGKATHKSGEELELSQIPGGKENADVLIDEGHLELIDENSTDEGHLDIEPKAQADVLIDEAKALEDDNDLLGALEKLNEATQVYPEGRKAPKLIDGINEKLG